MRSVESEQRHAEITKQRHSEIVKKNTLELPKNRYYELKYFCLQYRDWEELYSKSQIFPGGIIPGNNLESFMHKDPTAETAIYKKMLSDKIDMINDVIDSMNNGIEEYLLRGVTEGKSYAALTACGLPCDREYYYIQYQKFFKKLDEVRF